MDQQTLSRLFLVQYIIMAIFVLAVGSISIYKWAKEPQEEPVKKEEVVADKAAVAAN